MKKRSSLGITCFANKIKLSMLLLWLDLDLIVIHYDKRFWIVVTFEKRIWIWIVNHIVFVPFCSNNKMLTFQVRLLAILSILGGQWGSANRQNESVMECISNKLESEEIQLSNLKPLTRWEFFTTNKKVEPF